MADFALNWRDSTYERVYDFLDILSCFYAWWLTYWTTQDNVPGFITQDNFPYVSWPAFCYYGISGLLALSLPWFPLLLPSWWCYPPKIRGLLYLVGQTGARSIVWRLLMMLVMYIIRLLFGIYGYYLLPIFLNIGGLCIILKFRAPNWLRFVPKWLWLGYIATIHLLSCWRTYYINSPGTIDGIAAEAFFPLGQVVAESLHDFFDPLDRAIDKHWCQLRHISRSIGCNKVEVYSDHGWTPRLACGQFTGNWANTPTPPDFAWATFDEMVERCDILNDTMTDMEMVGNDLRRGALQQLNNAAQNLLGIEKMQQALSMSSNSWGSHQLRNFFIRNFFTHHRVWHEHHMDSKHQFMRILFSEWLTPSAIPGLSDKFDMIDARYDDMRTSFNAIWTNSSALNQTLSTLVPTIQKYSEAMTSRLESYPCVLSDECLLSVETHVYAVRQTIDYGETIDRVRKKFLSEWADWRQKVWSGEGMQVGAFFDEEGDEKEDEEKKKERRKKKERWVDVWRTLERGWKIRNVTQESLDEQQRGA